MNIITGFEVRYTAENKTLATDGPKDMADIVSDEMNVYLGIGSVLKRRLASLNMTGMQRRFRPESVGVVQSVF